MTRIQEALIAPGTAYARGATASMIDLQYGGMFGYAPNYAELVAAQSHVTRNMIPVLMEAPAIFQSLPDSSKWVSTLKNVMELIPTSIQGVDGTYDVSVDNTAVGGAGEMLDEVTNVKRGRTEITKNYTERLGRPLTRFFEFWVRYGLMDPDSKYALINTLGGNASKTLLSTDYGCTMLYIEPDPTHTRVVQSVLVTNMYPRGKIGSRAMKRDITSDMELVKFDQGFTGVSQYGLGVDDLAQRVLDDLSITGASPYAAKAFLDGISRDVAAESNVGYGALLQKLASEAVQS